MNHPVPGQIDFHGPESRLREAEGRVAALRVLGGAIKVGAPITDAIEALEMCGLLQRLDPDCDFCNAPDRFRNVATITITELNSMNGPR